MHLLKCNVPRQYHIDAGGRYIQQAEERIVVEEHSSNINKHSSHCDFCLECTRVINNVVSVENLAMALA